MQRIELIAILDCCSGTGLIRDVCITNFAFSCVYMLNGGVLGCLHIGVAYLACALFSDQVEERGHTVFAIHAMCEPPCTCLFWKFRASNLEF